MTRAAWLVPSVLVCACGPRALAPTPDGGGGPGSIATPGGGGTTADATPGGVGTISDAGGAGSDAGTDAGGGISDPRPGATACAPIADLPAPVVPPPARARVPTTPPFSCNPLPPAFIFPAPGPGVPGAFSRCASLDVGAVKRLALSADGLAVAMVPADGVVRVVEIATRQVVAVLASPRAMIDFAAFEPAGRGIMTLASGTREVTFWRATDWTPAWTVTLPGHRYDFNHFGGGVAFSPDGKSAVASPGDGTFLLDVASGATRAKRPAKGAMMDLAYGWGGRRIVVAEAATEAHCNHGPNGGVVTILDAATLADVATVTNLGSYGNPGGLRGIPAFLASPTEDLVLSAASFDQPPGIRAFKLSDGGALAAPAVDTLPIAFMPEGKVLVRADGRLTITDLSDGATSPAGVDDGSSPLAVSADGRILRGGRGQQLLFIMADPLRRPIGPLCGVSDPGAPSPYGAFASLSADGGALALGGDRQIRLLRTADGALLSTVSVDDPAQAAKLALSPDARFVVAAPLIPPTPLSTIAFRLSDGARVIELPSDMWNWADYVFSPGGDTLYTSGYRSSEYRLDVARLDGSGEITTESVAKYTTVVGFSFGCPVLYQQDRGAWRACGTCADPPVGGPGAPGKEGGVSSAVLSADGRVLAVRAPYDGPGVTVWPMQPGAPALRTFPRRAEESTWRPQEYPIAIAPGGARVVTGAIPLYSCYAGPQFEVHVHDGATGALIDALPPGVTTVDSNVRTFAYGAQIWCAR